MSDTRRSARAPRRLRREARTIAVMVEMSCRDHHHCGDRLGGQGREESGAGRHAGRCTSLCDECEELRAYAQRRLDRCPYGAAKPTCATCPTHCYRPDMRERVRAVMRYSGPRMLRAHPVLAVAHLLDGRRQPPDG